MADAGLTREPGSPAVERAAPNGSDYEPSATERYPKAPLGPRIHAETIDGLVTGGPFLVIVFLLGFLPDLRALSIVRPVLMVGVYVWALYYSLIKDGRPGGQSIGKEKTGLMVVKLATNEPCSRGDSAIRTLIGFAVSLVPVIGPFIEPFAVLRSRGGRRLGDRVAGTQVISVDAYGTSPDDDGPAGA